MLFAFSNGHFDIFKIDEDYDFPAADGAGAGGAGYVGGGNTEEDHELMDYDEPSVSYSQVDR